MRPGEHRMLRREPRQEDRDGMSSTRLRIQLLKGSGLVLAAARVVAFAPCDVSATLPASSAAPIFHCSGTPPAKAL